MNARAGFNNVSMDEGLSIHQTSCGNYRMDCRQVECSARYCDSCDLGSTSKEADVRGHPSLHSLTVLSTREQLRIAFAESTFDEQFNVGCEISSIENRIYQFTNVFGSPTRRALAQFVTLWVPGRLAPEIEAEFYGYVELWGEFSEIVESSKAAREHMLNAREKYGVNVPQRAIDICIALRAKAAAESVLLELKK